MKNNYLKLILIFSLSFFLTNNNSYSNDLIIKANELTIENEGKLIKGNKNAEAKIPNEIEIFADKIIYDKEKKILIADGNVSAFDIIRNINLKSDQVTFDQNKNEITTKQNTQFLVKNEITILSSDVIFNRNDRTISADEKTIIEDTLLNKVILANFVYFDDNETIRAKKINIIDNDNNNYFLEEGYLDLKKNEVVGKDISIFLKKDSFGIIDNDPRLRGNTIKYKNDLTKISKGIFTSCGSKKDNCPPWSIKSKEIIHDKKKQEIHYKDAWLRLYNIPVIYFPKFFHPDPTVDRKSGFLQPTFSNSKKLGSSIIQPYFHVIAENKDLTLKPRFFSEKNYLLQSEYRQENKSSSHIFDFSINETDNNSDGMKTHFFSNSKINTNFDFFKNSEFDIKIEKVSSDNYINDYSLASTSPIIENKNILENEITFSGENDSFGIDLSLEIYETLNRPNNDKYEIVYPNYLISKEIATENNFFSLIDLTSSGSQKTYSTNIYELTQVNDILFSSDDFFTRFGLKNKIYSLIKNVNTNGKNSSKLKNSNQSEILTQAIYDISLPLEKEFKEYKNFLTPKASLRFSPNDTKNIKDDERLIDTGNLFSVNRLGYSETIETDSSLTLGLDFDRINKNKQNIFSSKIGTVFRDKENKNLPITSTLNNKRSNVFAQINYQPNSIFNIDYNFSIDPDIDEIDLHKIKNTLSINNFVNTFTYYEENNLLGNKNFYENALEYNFDKANSLSFKTRKNKKDNLTEYYKLIYEYKNDCLTASIVYNKDYYNIASTKPNEDLFFNITLIPLGSTRTESILE